MGKLGQETIKCLNLKMGISVLIITKDRPEYLAGCLESISRQKRLPDEVVIVDSSRAFASKVVSEEHKNKLNVIYQREEKLGIAHARNKAFLVGQGDILAFIDDDCVAEGKWLEEIALSFNKDSNLDVLLGRCKNFFPTNVFATAQQSFYDRWLIESLSDMDKKETIDGRNFCDFENIAIRKSFVKDYQCSHDLLFNGWNEDREFGYRMADKGKFFYDPEMIVYHKHQTALFPLLKRNYYKGEAYEYLKQKKRIWPGKGRSEKIKTRWFKSCRQTTERFSICDKILFWLILFIYPIPYKLGRFSFNLKKLFKK